LKEELKPNAASENSQSTSAQSINKSEVVVANKSSEDYFLTLFLK
jgi:hypothetical protein